MITRLEWGDQGHNPHFVVTNLQGDAAALYDDLYCQRGEAENRIKEAQVGLSGQSCNLVAYPGGGIGRSAMARVSCTTPPLPAPYGALFANAR